MNLADLFKTGNDILYAKYSIPNEFQYKKRGIVLSHEEADILQQALSASRSLKYLLELEDELRETQKEIERLQKNNKDYVPPLDDYINEELKRVRYLEERIGGLRSWLFRKD